MDVQLLFLAELAESIELSEAHAVCQRHELFLDLLQFLWRIIVLGEILLVYLAVEE